MTPVDLAADFERENQLSRGGQCVFAPRHEPAAGVSAFAFDDDALAGGRGDVRHKAEIDAFLFEQRSLLDVQLDKLMKAARMNLNGFERPAEPGLGAPFLQSAALLVA